MTTARRCHHAMYEGCDKACCDHNRPAVLKGFKDYVLNPEGRSRSGSAAFVPDLPARPSHSVASHSSPVQGPGSVSVP